MKTYIFFWSFLSEFFLEWENFQTKIVEKIKTHTLCTITFFEGRAVYDKTWKNIVESSRSQTTIRRMSFASGYTSLQTHSM
jgi:hypothetical protein